MSDFGSVQKRMHDAVEKYRNLELKEFIENVLIDLGIGLECMENVYINEFVHYPGVWGCMKQEEKYVTYYTNERNDLGYSTFDEPYDFMWDFLRNSNKYSKIISSHVQKGISK